MSHPDGAPSTRRRTGLRRSQELMAFITIGARLAFRLAIVLLVLEVLALALNDSAVGRVLTAMAMAATAFVLWASTYGTRWVLRRLETRVHAAHPEGRLW